jgi:hypothetical protein
VRVAARRFGEVRAEDLGRLPARVVAGLLGDDGLAAGSEDEVYRAVAAYVEARDAMDGGGAGAGKGGEGGGGRLSGEERRAVWGCCRFAYCSAGVQAKLARLPEAAGGAGAGVPAGGGGGADGEGGRRGEGWGGGRGRRRRGGVGADAAAKEAAGALIYLFLAHFLQPLLPVLERFSGQH